MGVFSRAFLNNCKALTANPGETAIGVGAMILNNTLYFGSVSALLFQGNTLHPLGLKHYLIMQSVVFISWGAVNVFANGIRELGQIIESGELDTYLGSPKPALLLAGISRSDLGSLGDVVQGALMCIALGFVYSFTTSLGIVAASLISIFSVLSLFILAGAIALFFTRSKGVQEFIIGGLMICVGWPISPKLEGYERIFVYLTPLIGISFLNVEAVVNASAELWIQATLGSLFFFALALWSFQKGLRRYQSGNIVQLR
jgi:ABC-2 type transport system permease protein